jgi:hypothetical protein
VAGEALREGAWGGGGTGGGLWRAGVLVED